MNLPARIAATAALVAVALGGPPSVAYARPGMHNLRLELNGAAIILDQAERFDWGGGGGVAYGLAPIPYLEIQAAYRADFFRSLEDGSPSYGAFHGLGLALALHPAPELDAGDLWIAAGGDVVFTGEVVRPGINVRVGFDFSAHWAFRIGPYAGFHYLFQTDGADLGPGDGMFVTFGISMAFLGEEGEAAVESDRDGDGLGDGDDSCVNEPEDVDGFQDSDGCPDPDNDGDGVPDADDACPDQAPLGGRDQDHDGCPDEEVDSDGDGLLDSADGCPDAAEDADGFQDGDGCPDPDNDGDSIPDTADQCPDEAETANGFEDEDGCPDSAPDQAELTEIGQRILFPRASDQPTAATRGGVREVAAFLNAHPEIVEVRLEGHASSTGDPEFNVRLSRQRAERIRRLLIAAGVAADRLAVEAHGSAHASGSTDEDRRVTFTIVRRESQ